MNWERLREKILEENYPSKEEIDKANNLYEDISTYIRDNFDLKTYFAGSTGRKTCMSGDKDIDIFVAFSEDINRKELEEKGIEIGKKVFNHFDGDYRVEYAEHPYTKGEIKGHEVEIVPCYETDPEDIKSSVDRTPHHIKWLEQQLDEKKREEVVILKKFLKVQDLYGSSLKVHGFSGYLCEILINYYGSFLDLMENAQNWDETEIIDPENHHKDGLPGELKDKFDSNLIVIDPVDPERNVASVLSTENYSKFIYDSMNFLESPGIDFFQDKESSFQKIALKNEVEDRGDIIVIEFEKPDVVEDIIYPQMRRAHRWLKDVLEDEGFRIFNSGIFVGDKARIWFEMNSNLPKVKYMEGPKVFHGKKHVKQFKRKYDNVFVEEDRLKAKVEREYDDAKKLLKNFLDGDKEQLKKKGIPSHLSEKMVKYKFTDPLKENEKWLKYLAEKFQVIDNERS
ncbi:MAG: CCA tRNA nucleotidyltransferase [Candidatus Nanohaloarchaea archaeon]